MNNKDNYLINYDKVKIWKIKDAKSKLNEIEGLPLSDCTIKKLVFYNDEPILTGNGVYIFFKINNKNDDKNNNDKEYLYVGKCSSRSFVERVPSHFDIRNIGWFNSYLRNLVNENQEEKIKVKEFHNPSSKQKENDYNDLLKDKANISLNKHRLILINFENENYDSEKISKLEDIFNVILEPLNKYKNKKIDDRDIRISEYLNRD